MLQFQVFDAASQLKYYVHVINVELYVGLLIGVLCAVIFWNVVKGSE